MVTAMVVEGMDILMEEPLVEVNMPMMQRMAMLMKLPTRKIST